MDGIRVGHECVTEHTLAIIKSCLPNLKSIRFKWTGAANLDDFVFATAVGQAAQEISPNTITLTQSIHLDDQIQANPAKTEEFMSNLATHICTMLSANVTELHLWAPRENFPLLDPTALGALATAIASLTRLQRITLSLTGHTASLQCFAAIMGAYAQREAARCPREMTIFANNSIQGIGALLASRSAVHLQDLHVDLNQLDYQTATNLAQGLSSASSSVTSLSLNIWGAEDSAMHLLHQFLWQETTLQKLRLEGPAFGLQCSRLARQILHKPSLKSLHLNCVEEQDDDAFVRAIGEGLDENRSLLGLELPLFATSRQSDIRPLLASLHGPSARLEHLTLHFEDITSQSQDSLCHLLADSTCPLKTLDLRGTPGAKLVPSRILDAVKNNSKLMSLSLYMTGASDYSCFEQLVPFLPSVLHLRNLTVHVRGLPHFIHPPSDLKTRLQKALLANTSLECLDMSPLLTRRDIDENSELQQVLQCNKVAHAARAISSGTLSLAALPPAIAALQRDVRRSQTQPYVNTLVFHSLCRNPHAFGELVREYLLSPSSSVTMDEGV